MRYRLAVLTHGPGETLGAALDSFRAHVVPEPADVIVYTDGPGGKDRLVGWEGVEVTNINSFLQRGFCASTRSLWREALMGDHDHVFYLEHDFLLLRPVDLRDLAVVLDADRTLAQMSLMRGPANADEEAAGGLYEHRSADLAHASMFEDDRRHDYLEHRSYFTTNPSLMRRDFMETNPWPPYEANCEGLYGIDLVERGYRFGVWGRGEPWVDHVGRRTGKGY